MHAHAHVSTCTWRLASQFYTIIYYIAHVIISARARMHAHVRTCGVKLMLSVRLTAEQTTLHLARELPVLQLLEPVRTSTCLAEDAREVRQSHG